MDNAIETLRKTMRNRGRENNIATVARDVGVSANALDAFIYVDGTLPEAALHKLTQYAFGGVMLLDLENDTLTTKVKTESVPINRGPLPTEPVVKPMLAKDERQPPRNALKLERPARWDSKLDKLWRHRPESRGPLG